MSLNRKAGLWMLGVISILIISSLLSFNFLQKLHLANKIIAEDYEVTMNLRHLWGALFKYDDYSLLAAMSNDELDENLRKRNEYAHQLRVLLSEGEDNRPSLPGGKHQFDKVKQEIEELLQVKLEEKYSTSGPGPSELKRAVFLNPQYLKKYVDVMTHLEVMVDESSRNLSRKLAENQKFYKKKVLFNWTIIITTLLLVMLGLFYLRWRVLAPIHRMIKGLGRIRMGDWETKLEEDRTDEIGDVARTINQMIKDLKVRKKERIRFIGSVAHDIKNPLAAINLNCDLVLKNASRITPEMTQNAVKRMKNQVSQLIRLTEDLLQATKDSGLQWEMKMTYFSLEKLGQEVVDYFRLNHPTYLFELDLQNESVEVEADRDRIYQIFNNLLSNSVKYSPPSSLIKVKLGKTQDEVYFEVHDQGIGIPEEKRESVFEPFTRLDEGRELSTGTGLGLSIVREIIWAHKGRISVEPAPKGGSIFRVFLPQSHTHIQRIKFSSRIVKEKVLGHSLSH